VLGSLTNQCTAYTTQIFAPVITFAVFSTISRNKGGDVVLDTVRVYTSLSLFALMAEPIGALVMSLSMFVGSIGCFVRIQEFLNKDIRLDCRERPRQFSDSDNTSTDSNKLTVSEKSGIVTKEKEFDLTQSLENLYRSPSSDAITVQRASFGWDPTKEPILKSMTFSVPQNKLTMLVGPVGCGKSTLLKAVLGEVPRMAGSVRVSSPSLAFCDQTPWHMNETVQKSIVAMSEIDENWYSLVIHACALEKDLHHLPLGDQTIIGSKGVALSAGQNQRVVGLTHRIISFFLKERIRLKLNNSGLGESHICQKRNCYSRRFTQRS
jgi:ATP-binding cassette subfamily C (CFTR/MRP) protein 1